jgi:hypothetical protein
MPFLPNASLPAVPQGMTHAMLLEFLGKFGQVQSLHLPGRVSEADRIGLVTFAMRWSLIDALDTKGLPLHQGTCAGIVVRCLPSAHGLRWGRANR